MCSQAQKDSVCENGLRTSSAINTTGMIIMNARTRNVYAIRATQDLGS